MTGFAQAAVKIFACAVGQYGLGVAKEQNGAHDGILQVLHRKDSLFSSAEMSVSLVEIKFLTGRTSDFLMTDRVKFK